MEKRFTPDHVFAALIVLAAMLHLGLTEWGTQRVADFCTYSVIEGGPSGHILFAFYFSVADTFSCVHPALSTTTGLFTRLGLSPLASLLGGVWAPGLILFAVIGLTWRYPRRISFSLMGAALFTFVVFVSTEPQWAEYRNINGQQHLYGPYTDKPLETPLITFSRDRSHCHNCTEFLLWGLYPRTDVPRGLALLGLLGAMTMFVGGVIFGVSRIAHKRVLE